MEDFEKVKGSKTKVDVGLIDFELIPTSEDVTHGDASQQDEDHEDVGKPCIKYDRVKANHDAILLQIGNSKGANFLMRGS